MVVSPNDRLRRAYSSLPTRMSVISSRRTTAASTFSRGNPRLQVALVCRRMRGSALAKAIIRAKFSAPRRCRQSCGYRPLPARVTRGLQVAIGPRADPDIRPSRRDHDRPDPVEGLTIADHIARRVAVAEAPTFAVSCVARSGVRGVAKPACTRGRFAVIGRVGHGRDGRGARLVAAWLLLRHIAAISRRRRREWPIRARLLGTGPVAIPALGDGRDGTSLYVATARWPSSSWETQGHGRSHPRASHETVRRRLRPGGRHHRGPRSDDPRDHRTIGRQDDTRPVDDRRARPDRARSASWARIRCSSSGRPASASVTCLRPSRCTRTSRLARTWTSSHRRAAVAAPPAHPPGAGDRRPLVGPGPPRGQAVRRHAAALELASALVHDPAIMFLDEPTAGIDPLLRATVWQELTRLRDEGRTVLVTTQYVGEAEQCDAVLLISDGRVIAAGTPRSCGGPPSAATSSRWRRPPHSTRGPFERWMASCESSNMARPRSERRSQMRRRHPRDRRCDHGGRRRRLVRGGGAALLRRDLRDPGRAGPVQQPKTEDDAEQAA